MGTWAWAWVCAHGLYRDGPEDEDDERADLEVELDLVEAREHVGGDVGAPCQLGVHDAQHEGEELEEHEEQVDLVPEAVRVHAQAVLVHLRVKKMSMGMSMSMDTWANGHGHAGRE